MRLPAGAAPGGARGAAGRGAGGAAGALPRAGDPRPGWQCGSAGRLAGGRAGAPRPPALAARLAGQARPVARPRRTLAAWAAAARSAGAGSARVRRRRRWCEGGDGTGHWLSCHTHSGVPLGGAPPCSPAAPPRRDPWAHRPAASLRQAARRSQVAMAPAAAPERAARGRAGAHRRIVPGAGRARLLRRARSHCGQLAGAPRAHAPGLPSRPARAHRAGARTRALSPMQRALRCAEAGAALAAGSRSRAGRPSPLTSLQVGGRPRRQAPTVNLYETPTGAPRARRARRPRRPACWAG